MFYVSDPCRICGNGLLGLYRCSDRRTIVVVCDECGTVWDVGNIAESDPIQFLNSPDPPLPEHGCSLGGPNAGWATASEIEAAGLNDIISGKA